MQACPIPVIDFAQNEPQLVQDLHQACCTYGACYLIHHPIPAKATQACFQAAKAFFDLPVTQKRSIAMRASPYNRGWYGQGEEILDTANWPQGDYKEGIKIGNDLPSHHKHVRAGTPLHGPNQWPDETQLGLAGWKATMQDYYTRCTQFARAITRLLALGLKLPPTYFDSWFSEPMATLSPLRYPPEPPGHISAAPHTDFGCCTLLIQDHLPGLEVETAQGWQSVPVLPGGIVLSMGDMMARWTNDMYQSLRHRVHNRNRHTRHSIAFFFDPEADTPIEMLPPLRRAGESPHYPPTTALAHLLTKIDASLHPAPATH